MTFWLGMSGASNAITRSTLIRNWRVSMRNYESLDNSLLEFLSCDSFGGSSVHSERPTNCQFVSWDNKLAACRTFTRARKAL